MRALGFIGVLILAVCGCSRNEAERLAFDRLLASNRIDRILVVDQEEGRTNVMVEDKIAPLLARFAADNRVRNPIRSKSYVSGHIAFYEGEQRVAVLHYFPREQVWSFQDYEFSFRDTNGVALLFR